MLKKEVDTKKKKSCETVSKLNNQEFSLTAFKSRIFGDLERFILVQI